MKVILLLLAGSLASAAGFTPHISRQGGSQASPRTDPREDPEFNQQWAYVEVRPGAHMFYWLFYTDHQDGWQNRPTVIWLQGGPGSSSTGYGNFDIIGPRTIDLEYRNTTWCHQANVIFVDNPVGAGYSYVEHDDLFTRDVDEIAADLLTLWTTFLQNDNNTQFQTLPLYIFGQSYGGKMGVVFAQYVYNAIQNDGLATNLGGIAMGNAWIVPIDSVMTWAPFLYWMSTTDEQGVAAIDAAAQDCKLAVEEERWNDATDLWGYTEMVVWNYTNFVDFYNILKFVGPGTLSTTHIKSLNLPEEMRVAFASPSRKKFFLHKGMTEEEYNAMFAAPETRDPLDDLMNGEVKEYLGIIPEEVVHGGQQSDVFYYQEGDFMKPVLETVDWMLINTNVDVIIYQGQLDLICDTKAAHDFVLDLTWANLDDYLYAERKPFVEPMDGQTDTFVKAYNQFKFYWMLRAGHAVPKDMPEAGFRMLERILGKMDT